MGIKHRLSSSFDDLRHQGKRLRLSPVPKVPYRQCLHCNSAEHDFTRCEVMCTYCGHLHRHRRCPLLPVAFYTPSAFRRCVAPRSGQLVGRAVSPSLGTCENDTVGGVVSSPVDAESSVAEAAMHRHSNGVAHTLYEKPPIERAVDHPAATARRLSSSLMPIKAEPDTHAAPLFNPERAAMIASTPVLDPSPAVKGETKLGPECGPQKSGMNTLPLGPKRPIGTSWTLDNRRAVSVEARQSQTSCSPAPQTTLPASGANGPLSPFIPLPTPRRTFAQTAQPRSPGVPLPGAQLQPPPPSGAPVGKEQPRSSIAANSQPPPPGVIAPIVSIQDPPPSGSSMSEVHAHPVVRLPLATKPPASTPSQTTIGAKTNAAPPPPPPPPPPPAAVPRPNQPMSRDRAREQIVFKIIQTTIRQCIKEVSAPGKPYSNPLTVNERVEKALAALRPVVLGTSPTQDEVNLDKCVAKVKEMEQKGMRITFGAGGNWSLKAGGNHMHFNSL